MSKFYKFVLNNPKLIITIITIITIFFAFFIDLSFDFDLEKMIPDDDPVIKDLYETVDDFGPQKIFMIVLRCNNIYNENTIKKVRNITDQLKNLKGIKKVINPLDADMIISNEFGIEIKPLTDKLPQTAKEILEFKKNINYSLYGRKLVSEDEKAVALLLDLDTNITSLKLKQLTKKIDEIMYKNKGPEEIYVISDDYTGFYAENIMKKDITFLLPLIIIILCVLLYWSFHSILGVILPLLTVLIGIIWTVGLMSLLNIPLTIVTMVMPIILVAIGSADGIHILNKYYETLAEGKDKKTAIEETMIEMHKPVIMTSLTTAAGFIALITSFVIPIREFGVFTAFGVIAAMLFSLAFIPSVLVLQKLPVHFDKETKEHQKKIVVILTRLGYIMTKKTRLIIHISLVLLAIFLFGSFFLPLESNLLRYFQEDSPIIEGTKIVEEEFGGTMQISLVFDTGKNEGVNEPEVLQKMVEAQDYLNSLERVSQATSLADLVKEINKALNNGEEAYYRIPDTRQAVAQELLLFTIQGGSDLESLVSYNFDKALVSARVENMSSGELERLINNIENYVERKFSAVEGLKVKVVGLPKVMMRLTDRYVSGQIISLITSIVTVYFIVTMLLNSYIAGLICILPLILTVSINFGIMGYAGIPLDSVTSTIASIAIGIGVDYSIHYFSRYKKEIMTGRSREEAIITTSRTAGRGIFFNALTLILGFGILIFSHFRAIDVFGYLISLTMIISSLASLTIIPCILNLLSVKYIVKK